MPAKELMVMTTGFKFCPTDEELIQILERKVYGEQMPLHGHFIVERNFYELDPQDLEWDDSIAALNKERYCYYMRENDSREVSGRGWWRATGHVKKIYGHGRVVGNKRPLTFHKFMDNDRNRNKATKTGWIMHEYSLESNATEWRLCKIKYYEKKSKQNYYTSRNDFEASSSITSMEPDFVGQQQPEEQPLPLDCVYRPYLEPSITSMAMQHYGTEEQLQSKSLLIDYVLSNEPHNMQQGAVNELQQQPQASFDDYPAYYLDDHLEFESSGQTFPGLWSWQN